MTRGVQCIRFRKEGDGYLLRFDVTGKACVYRATRYGVLRVIQSHRAVYDGERYGWHVYRVPNPQVREPSPRYCVQCGAQLDHDARSSRRYCGAACRITAASEVRRARILAQRAGR